MRQRQCIFLAIGSALLGGVAGALSGRGMLIGGIVSAGIYCVIFAVMMAMDERK